MRVNEYNNLEEVDSVKREIIDLYEEDFVKIDNTGLAGSIYDAIDRKNIQGFCGIEFTYQGVYYRMCREPIAEEKLPTLPNGHKGHYHVVIVHWKDGKWFTDFDYELIGWYETIEDLLKNCHIEGKTFKEVIMADETEIIGKD